MVCAFENKEVHAIDYASGDIVYEFIFKDDAIPANTPPSHHHDGSITAGDRLKRKKTLTATATSTAQRIMKYKIQQALKRGQSPEEGKRKGKQEKKKEVIISQLQSKLAKKVGDTVEGALGSDYFRPGSPSNLPSPTKNDQRRGKIMTQSTIVRNRKRHLGDSPSPNTNEIKSPILSSEAT